MGLPTADLAGELTPCRRKPNRCCALKIHNPGPFQVSGKPRTERGSNTSQQRGPGLAQPVSPAPGFTLGAGPAGGTCRKGSHPGGSCPHRLIPSHPRPPPCLCSAVWPAPASSSPPWCQACVPHCVLIPEAGRTGLQFSVLGFPTGLITHPGLCHFTPTDHLCPPYPYKGLRAPEPQQRFPRVWAHIFSAALAAESSLGREGRVLPGAAAQRGLSPPFLSAGSPAVSTVAISTAPTSTVSTTTALTRSATTR